MAEDVWDIDTESVDDDGVARCTMDTEDTCKCAGDYDHIFREAQVNYTASTGLAVTNDCSRRSVLAI